MKSFTADDDSPSESGVSITHPSSQLGITSSTSISGGEDFFSTIPIFDDIVNEDDFESDDIDETKDGLADLLRSDAATKLRRPASTAEKKATHNAVERARRESLNTRFLVLAELLPGMSHPKRAPKAAIVNRSIELIQNLQSSEARLVKENEALRIELKNLRQRSAGASAKSQSATVALPQMPLLAGPTAIRNAATPHKSTLSQQAQQNTARSSSSAPSEPILQNVQQHRTQHHQMEPMYSEDMRGILELNGLTDNIDIASAQSGSPLSSISNLPDKNGTNGPFYQANGFFDIVSIAHAQTVQSDGKVGSPQSFQSPTTTIASCVAGKSHSNGIKDISAASPVSSTSVTSPPNPHSPVPLSCFAVTGNGVNPSGHTSSAPNPAIAAFDTTHDAAFLAAQFAPQDLAKAQAELQQFINYQNTLAAVPGIHLCLQHQQPPSGLQGYSYASALGMGFPMASAPFAENRMANIPAWQMMMAQQQALSAYGGQMPF